MELQDIRREIDAIDGELVRLFRRRMEAVAAVAEAKRGSGAAVVDAANARKPGAAFRLSDETRETGGGLVLRRGKVELNCGFTEKLRRLRQEESSAVAKLLFD